jgi:membrane protein YdbS with pleckstrin-like domain
MTYINDSLAPNERVIYRARFHWLQKAGAYITLATFVAIALTCLLLAQGLSVRIGSAAAIIALGAGIFVVMLMPIWTTEIGVTNQRFIFKRGWLRRSTDELQLSSIEEVNLKQGTLGRLFDYGRLILHGTGVNDIKLPPLADPVGLRRALQEGMGAARAAVVVAPTSNSTVPQGSAVA